MRIGFDATVLAAGTRYTGTGQYAARLLEHLPAIAPDDEFVIYATGGAEPARQAVLNVEWRALNRLPAGKLSALATHLLSLPKLMRQDRLDVLHVPAVHTRPSLPPVPRFVPCPIVVTMHDLIPLTFYERSNGAMPWRMRHYYRWNLRAAAKARHIITVSETSRAEIIEILEVRPQNVTAIYNGIDFDSWSQPDPGGVSPYRGNRPYILFGGSYEPRKNLLRLLDAFEIAVRAGLPHDLVMVVDATSGYAAGTRRYASTLGCAERLHFFSDLREPALRALYRDAELFVFPSLSEGFGFPPLQAMASGVPVVTSDLAVLHEVLGEAALFVDPYDVPSIAGALRSITLDPALAGRLADAGRIQAARYSWAESARHTMDVLRAAAREKV